MNDLNLPQNEIVRNQQLHTSVYSNQFHERAKQGFEFWTKDKRDPENNKTKGMILNQFG